MKRIVAIIGLVMGSFLMMGFTSGGDNDCPMTAYKTYHDNGELRFDGAYNCDGVLHGKFTEYYDNGALAGHGEYDNGVRSGTWVMHCINGVQYYIVEYENGKRKTATFYKNGEFIESRAYNVEEGTYQLVDATE